MKAKPTVSVKNNVKNEFKSKITYTYDTSDDESEQEDNNQDNVPEGVVHANQVTPTTNETTTETSDTDDDSRPNNDAVTGAIPKLILSKKGKTWTLSSKREQRKASIISGVITKNIGLEDSSDENFMECVRSDSNDPTPIPSRDNSLDRVEDMAQLEDYPPEYSYEAEHTTAFEGGNPTYLGQLYDVTLGSPLLMALAPSSTPGANISPNSDFSLARPSVSSPDASDTAFKFPTRIFYRTRKSQDSSCEDPGSWSA